MLSYKLYPTICSGIAYRVAYNIFRIMFYKVYDKIQHDNRKFVLSEGALGLIGSGVSAVGNLFGGLATSSSNKKLMREQMAWQEKMYARQLQDNRQNALLEQHYNSPSVQRSLLEGAGYNAGLMGSDLQAVSSAANIDGADTGSAPTYSSTPNYIADTVNSATQAFSTLVAAQVATKNANIGQQNADTNAKNADTNAQNADTQAGLAYHANALTREQIQLSAQENAYKSEYLQTQINQMKANTNLTRVQTGIARITGEWLPYEKSMQIAKLSADIDDVLMDVKLKKSNIKVAEAQVKQLLASAYLLTQQGKTTEDMRDLQIREQRYTNQAAHAHALNMQAGVSDTFNSDKWLSNVTISANGSLNVYGASGGASVSFSRGNVTDGASAILDMVETLNASVRRSNGFGVSSSELSQPGVMSQ